MSTEEHLYENLMIFVQENGWQSFPEFLTDEEAEAIRKKSSMCRVYRQQNIYLSYGIGKICSL